MRAPLPISLLAVGCLAGCASASASTGTSSSQAGPAAVPNGSYALPQGVADYDSLQRERTRCAGQGGVLTPRAGADLSVLGDYNCVIGKGN